MKVEKIKLLADGRGGIKADVIEPMVKGGVTVFDTVQRIRKIPVPEFLRNDLKTVRYYLLILCGYWHPSWDKYLRPDKNNVFCDTDVLPVEYKHVVKVFDATTVTGVKMCDSGIIITGKMKVLGEKVTALCTPLVKEEDAEEFGLFDELVERIQKIFKSTVYFITSEEFLKQEPKHYLLDLFNNDEDMKREIEEKDPAEAEKEMIEHLQNKGYMVVGTEVIEGMVVDGKEKFQETTDYNDLSDVEKKELEEKVTGKVIDMPIAVEPVHEKIKKQRVVASGEVW